VDANAYYSQVRKALTPLEFQNFASNIKSLNAGHQTVEETLSVAKSILGEDKPFLFSQLQALVRQAQQQGPR